jgi:hypothetical protein
LARHRELADVERATGRRRLIASDFACRKFNRCSKTALRNLNSLHRSKKPLFFSAASRFAAHGTQCVNYHWATHVLKD